MKILRDPSESAINFVVRCAKQTADLHDDAAGRVSDPDVKALFEGLAGARRKLADRLSVSVEAMGARPEAPDPDSESLHRLWNAARARFGDENQVLLADRERAEAELGEAIEEACAQEDLPDAVRPLLEDAKDQVEAVREDLRAEAARQGA